MVTEGDQSFEGLIDHLCNAFQLGEMLHKLISDFNGRSQKARETKDIFADDLQVLAQKIIACKPSFWLEAKQQLKAQYVQKLWDPYYAATVQCNLPPEEERYTRFWGCLVTMFDGCMRQN